MRPTYGLSNNQMRVLSGDRRGLNAGENQMNYSQEYERIKQKALIAADFLAFLANRDYEQLPKPRYESTLPIDKIITFIDEAISGHNRIKDRKGIKRQDTYGALLAAECLKICLDKLEHEYGLALESRMTAKDNRRHVKGKGTLLVYSKTFEEKARELRRWSETILHEIGAYTPTETTKSSSATD